MNLIIDITRLVRRVVSNKNLTGIDRVSMAYVEQYAHTAQALVRWSGQNLILSKKQSENLFFWLLNPKSKATLITIIAKGILSKRAQKKLAGALLLNTGHIGLKQKNYVRKFKKLKLKPVFFVHDLIPIIYPEFCSIGEDIRHKTKINYVLEHAHGVIANSQATLIDLEQYAKANKQSMPSATSALLASGVRSIAPSIRPIEKPYFVMLSTIDPRKNHLLLLQVWRNLVQKIGDDSPHLIILGQRGWECEQVLDLLERCQFLKNVVTEIPHCKDQELVNYIHHSQALLFPSFAEGYGLPLIEALSLNVPVIASDLPVFQEIAADVPEYIDPLDGKKWLEIILEYSKKKSVLREAQILRIKNFKEPTWNNHFLKVNSFLEKLCM